MTVGEIVWLGLLALVLAWEIIVALVKPRWTLTSILRRRFAVKTSVGLAIWLTVWILLAALMTTHVAWGWPV